MRFFCPWDSNILNDDKKDVKKMKNLQISSKNAKIHDVKKLKTVSLPIETVQ